jgi:hypothetical protein
MTQMSPLRRRMIEDMSVRNLSPATQRSYISAVSKLSYFGQSPDKLELEDVALSRCISFDRVISYYRGTGFLQKSSSTRSGSISGSP